MSIRPSAERIEQQSRVPWVRRVMMGMRPGEQDEDIRAAVLDRRFEGKRCEQSAIHATTPIDRSMR